MRVAVAFTGGKDSILALHRVQETPQYELVCLVVFRPPGKVFRAHPFPLMEQQACALGLSPLVEMELNPAKHGNSYKDAYAHAIRRLRDRHRIDILVSGDIDVIDYASLIAGPGTSAAVVDAATQSAMSNNFLTECCEAADCGIRCELPLWKNTREELLQEMIVQRDFHIVMTCVKSPYFDGSWIGKRLDGAALQEMRHMIMERTNNNNLHNDNNNEEKVLDLCGENGEYHTCVLDAPLFRHGRLQLENQSSADGSLALAEELHNHTGQLEGQRIWVLQKSVSARLIPK